MELPESMDWHAERSGDAWVSSRWVQTRSVTWHIQISCPWDLLEAIGGVGHSFAFNLPSGYD